MALPSGETANDPFGLNYDGSDFESRIGGVDLGAFDAPAPVATGVTPEPFDPAILNGIAEVLGNVPFDLAAKYFKDCGFKLNDKQEAACRDAVAKALAYGLSQVDWGRYLMTPYGAVLLTMGPIFAGKFMEYRFAQMARLKAVDSMASNGTMAAAGAASSSAEYPEAANQPSSEGGRPDAYEC